MDLLFLGDSLIEFYDWQKEFPEYNVANLGLAGESVEELFSRVFKVKDVCPRADLILIMSGINNIAMGDMGLFDFYRGILEKLSSFYPGADIFVHSLLPTTVMFISNESIRQANDDLRKLAEDAGVHYLDLYSRFMKE